MGLTAIETAAIDHARAAPMLAQVERWVAVNSGTRNLPGLATMAEMLANAFSVLPGELTLVEPAPVETVDGKGDVLAHRPWPPSAPRVRPDAPSRCCSPAIWTRSSPPITLSRPRRWLDDGRLNAPGAADMKGGLALMLAALEAVEASPLAAQLRL